MTITRDTVEHVAKLARLELSTEEVDRYTEDLSQILTLVEQMGELDLSDVELGMTLDNPTVVREDKGIRTFSREELMENAPNVEDGFFRVPRILE